MDFNFAYNRPNSFFKDKKAIVTIDLINLNNEEIKNGTVVTINCKSYGLKVYFDIVDASGINIYKVLHESLELIK